MDCEIPALLLINPEGTLLEWLDCEAVNPSTLIPFSSRRVLAPTTAHELTPHKLQKTRPSEHNPLLPDPNAQARGSHF